MDQLQQLQRDIAALKGTPLPDPEPCLRLACKGSTTGPSKLCGWCQRVWSESDARMENVGHRLGYSPGSWPSMDHFGVALEDLEEIDDAQLHCLAKQRGVSAPANPAKKEALAKRFATEKAEQEHRKEQATITRLKAHAEQIAKRLESF